MISRGVYSITVFSSDEQVSFLCQSLVAAAFARSSEQSENRMR